MNKLYLLFSLSLMIFFSSCQKEKNIIQSASHKILFDSSNPMGYDDQIFIMDEQATNVDQLTFANTNGLGEQSYNASWSNDRTILVKDMVTMETFS